ncbi:MAG: DASH family cryptochrome [Phycisphaerales bacterium]|nr:DASH family cryptochrome [Phycisphaerales bacterium]
MMAKHVRRLLWFRNELRIHDQPLFEGRERLDHDAIGVWILDPRSHVETIDGYRRSGSHRLRFLIESVAFLRTSLQGLGSDLIIRIGHPEDVLPELMDQLQLDDVVAVRQPGTQEQAIEQSLAIRLGDRWSPLEYDSILDIDDVQTFADDLPEVFSRFRRQAEKKLEFSMPRVTPSSLGSIDPPSGFESGPIPDLSSLGYEQPCDDERAVLRFHGGEEAGLRRLDEWMFANDNLQFYKQTRNGMLGEQYSSKFSPWLATGSLSARHILHETLRYESERTSNDSTYWLRFELLWREYFHLYMLKHGASLFMGGGPGQSSLQWSNPSGHFEAWREGRTGVPLVDANMIELSRTGFMSNRGRQIVASFLSKNLDVDWRLGARWFEHCLIDYCPAANWGNWTYAAGVGADPRGFRGFDIARQAANYDAQGDYVSIWLGESIASLPIENRHAPWLAGGPRPIVDPVRSLQTAKARWEAASQDD